MKVQQYGIDIEILVKEKRKEARLSQTKLSIQSGVSRSYISELEKGKYVPTVLIMGKLAKALNCSIDSIVIVK